MATYVIGDIHGCFDELQTLLTLIHFNPAHDKLWFTGDLVNGGPKSIETLSFIQALGDQAICVLGNHDLTLLGIALADLNYEHHRKNSYATMLSHPRLGALLDWLKTKPLIHYDATFNTLLVHAGLAPQWTVTQALSLGNEINQILVGNQAIEFFKHMFGNHPTNWDEHLTGWDRARCIVNYMTRLRFCTHDGTLDFAAKGTATTAPLGTMPWFDAPNRQTPQVNIVFGHWAALNGETNVDKVFALDTGCVWGNKLTAMRLDDKQRFSVNSTVKNI